MSTALQAEMDRVRSRREEVQEEMVQLQQEFQQRIQELQMEALRLEGEFRLAERLTTGEPEEGAILPDEFRAAPTALRP